MKFISIALAAVYLPNAAFAAASSVGVDMKLRGSSPHHHTKKNRHLHEGQGMKFFLHYSLYLTHPICLSLNMLFIFL